MASWLEEQNLRHSSMNRLRYRWRMTVGTLPPNSFGIIGFFKVWREHGHSEGGTPLRGPLTHFLEPPPHRVEPAGIQALLTTGVITVWLMPRDDHTSVDKRGGSRHFVFSLSSMFL